MSNVKKFIVNDNFIIDSFIASLEDFLNSFNMETQSFRSDNSYVVQARERSSWKKRIAMDKAVSLKIELSSKTLTVELGQGKWSDKAVGAAVGYFLFWPALLPAALGAYEQSQLPKKIFSFIDEYVMNIRVQQVSISDSIICNNCGSFIGEGSTFCSNCGFKLSESCMVCGAVVNLSDRFCKQCGSEIIRQE